MKHQKRSASARSRRSRRSTLALLFCAMLCSCTMRENLQAPTSLASPYERRELWAVAPFANESGVSIVKTDRIADLFVEQAEQVDGVETVPVNRVLQAMKRLEMRRIASSSDAVTLMNILGVDGLIVGSITAYDPYQPPKIGAAIQLYRNGWPRQTSDIDHVKVTRSPTEIALLGTLSSQEPIAQAAGVFDASNHQTLMQLEEYANGRTEPDSAFGSRIYLVNMEMYTQFVAYRLMHDLLERERVRLTPPATQPSSR